ncbi:hypothetical protein IJD34_06600 [bacterium]|nr:hypothetical protein [bacterium]
MQADNFYSAISKFEDTIDRSFKFLLFFDHMAICSKQQILKDLKNLYKSLPQEIQENKKILLSSNKPNTLKQLEFLSKTINASKDFWGFIVLDIGIVTSLIDEIYAVLPDTIRDIHNL